MSIAWSNSEWLNHQDVIPAMSCLRLMRWASPTLPTGGFAYSNGLETLVTQGHITEPSHAVDYLTTLLQSSMTYLDLPIVIRMHRAWLRHDLGEARRFSQSMYVARESRESQAQERQMGSALCRLLRDTFPEAALAGWVPFTYAEAFSRAAVLDGIDELGCCLGYAYAWIEAHSSAFARLIPLGPIAAQRLIGAALQVVPAVVGRAFLLGDEEFGYATPGLGLALAQHETQHCRLFRS